MGGGVDGNGVCRGTMHGQCSETECTKRGLRWELEALEGILLLKSNEYVWSSFHLVKRWSSW